MLTPFGPRKRRRPRFIVRKVRGPRARRNATICAVARFGLFALIHRVPVSPPFFVSTGYCPHLRESPPPQLERRTGTRLFGRSTAICDDRLPFRAEFFDVRSHCRERNPQRTWHVTRRKLAFAPNVNDD